MDIETLKRIQETEKALRIHNISISPQEAITEVSRDVYVGGTKVPTFEEVSDSAGARLLKAKEEAYFTQLKKEVPTMDNKDAVQLKKTIDEQNELITKQAKMIYELQGTVNEIIKEIRKMQTSVPTKNPSERQVVLKPEDKTQHPRSGGYTPGSDEVSVEKFFYAGSK